MGGFNSRIDPLQCVSTQNPVKVHEIVEIIVHDPRLLKYWPVFCDEIGSSPRDKLRWSIGIALEGVQHSAVFTQIVTDWISRSSEEKTISDFNKILTDIDCGDISRTLSKTFGNSVILYEEESGVDPQNEWQLRRTQWPFSHGIILPIQKFNGRVQELEELSAFIRKEGRFVNSQNIVVVNGIGGMGKTELCRKFLFLNEKLSRIWLEGDTLESLTKSIKFLSRKLEIECNSGTIVHLFKYLLKKILENSPPVIVVIDNVEILYKELIEIMLTAKKHAGLFLIVISRDKLMIDTGGNTLELKVLEKRESMAVLKDSIDDVTDSDAILLCHLLQNYPLALQQAVVYIKMQRENRPSYSVLDYVREFKAKKVATLGQKPNQIDVDYSSTALVTWEMAFSKLSKDSLDVLKTVAYFQPDEIEIGFLKETCSDMGLSEERFNVGLNILTKYNLIKMEVGSCSIHRLVQEVVRKKLGDGEFCKRLFDVVLLILFRHGSSKYDELLVHIGTVHRFAFGQDFGVDLYLEAHEILRRLLVFERVDCAKKFIKMTGLGQTDLSGLDEQASLAVLEKLIVFWMCGEMSYSEIKLEVLNSGDWELKSKFKTYYYYDLKPYLVIAEKNYGKKSKFSYYIKVLMAYESLRVFRLTECYSLCLELLDPQCHHLHLIFYERVRDITGWENTLYLFSMAGLLAKLIGSSRTELSETTIREIKVELAKALESLDLFPAAIALFKEVQSSEEGISIKEQENVETMTLQELTYLTPQEITTHFHIDSNLPLKQAERLLEVYEFNEGSNLIKGEGKGSIRTVKSLVDVINGIIQFEQENRQSLERDLNEGSDSEDECFRKKMKRRVLADFHRFFLFRETQFRAFYPEKVTVKKVLVKRLQNKQSGEHLEKIVKLRYQLLNHYKNNSVEKYEDLVTLHKQKLATALERLGEYEKALELRKEVFISCEERFGEDDWITKEKKEFVTILERKDGVCFNYSFC